MKSSDSENFDRLGMFCDDDFEDKWESNEAKAEFLPNRYQDKEFIAAGALKNVFKVFDTKMTRHVALAELKEEIPEEQYEDFFTEASLTSSLRHPNIITVYEFGFNEVHIPYFTMELKVGDTLSDILKNQQKSLDCLLEIFLKVCDAVSYSHSQSIIHLDLKPDNIQVGEFGEVQVCDWGLSKKAGNLKTGELLKGTPGFMAPEQIMPGEELNSLTDIFALGGILYSVLTRQLPIEGGCNTVITATVLEEVKPPLERCPDKNIPVSLNAVVCKAMKLDRGDRYVSVEELKSEVANYLLGRSTEAENAGFIKEFKLFIKRNKQICLLSFVSMFILIVGGVFFLFEIKKQQRETENALEKLQKTHIDLTESREKEKSLFAQKEKTFKMFLKASKEHERIYNLLQGSELTKAYELMVYPLYFASPVQSLDKSLKILISQNEMEKPKPWLNDFIVLNLFISQKFKELQSFKSEKYNSLIELGGKYLNVERSGFGVLLDKDFIELLRDLNAFPIDKQKVKEEVMERLVCYAQDARDTNFIHGQVVREIVQCWNPYWNSEYFFYKKNESYLKLYGENLTNLKSKDLNSSGKSFLRFLKIENLDISNSFISSFLEVDGLSLKSINIRNTAIVSTHPHRIVKAIQLVYLSAGQIDLDKYTVPKSVKLIED